MDYRSLGQRIRKQRKAQRMTQEQLAERAGISLSFLGHIERGTRKASVETLVNISNALSLPLDTMLQESLNDEVLKKLPINAQQAEVLQEISRLIDSSRINWMR